MHAAHANAVPFQIMPLSYRAKGVSLSTATNWFFNYVVGELTPLLQEVMGWRLYPMFGLFCACSFVVGQHCPVEAPPPAHRLHAVYFLYPETMGVPLEEMDAVFGEGATFCCMRCMDIALIQTCAGKAKAHSSTQAAYHALPTSTDMDA
jgi:hypothetical protein